MKGLARAVQRGADLDTAIARADKIDWADPNIWENVLIKPNGGMIARTEAYNHAADLIAYLVASEKTQQQQADSLRRSIAILKGVKGITPDTPLEQIPELPEPIVEQPIAA